MKTSRDHPKSLAALVTSAVNSLLAFLGIVERGHTKKRHETFNLLHTMGTEWKCFILDTPFLPDQIWYHLELFSETLT